MSKKTYKQYSKAITYSVQSSEKCYGLKIVIITERWWIGKVHPWNKTVLPESSILLAQ